MDFLESIGTAVIAVAKEAEEGLTRFNRGVFLTNALTISVVALTIFSLIEASLAFLVGACCLVLWKFHLEETLEASLNNLRSLFPNLKGGDQFLPFFRRQVTSLA